MCTNYATYRAASDQVDFKRSMSLVWCFSSEVQVPAIEYVTYFIRDLKTNGFLFFIKVSMYHSFEI